MIQITEAEHERLKRIEGAARKLIAPPTERDERRHGADWFDLYAALRPEARKVVEGSETTNEIERIK